MDERDQVMNAEQTTAAETQEERRRCEDEMSDAVWKLRVQYDALRATLRRRR